MIGINRINKVSRERQQIFCIIIIDIIMSILMVSSDSVHCWFIHTTTKLRFACIIVSEF